MIDLTSPYRLAELEKRIASKDHPRVDFTVYRGGQPVERFGTITRLTPTLVWIGAFVYWHHEPKNIQEVA